MSTDFSIKVEVLADVYAEAQWNKQLEQFKKYNDVGLPLAHFTHLKLSEVTVEGEKFINETWDDLCQMLNIDPDAEYKSAEEVLDEAGLTDDEEDN